MPYPFSDSRANLLTSSVSISPDPSFILFLFFTLPLHTPPSPYCTVMMKRFERFRRLIMHVFLFLFDSRSGSIFHERSFISQRSLPSHRSRVCIPVSVHSWMGPSFVFILLFYAFLIFWVAACSWGVIVGAHLFRLAARDVPGSSETATSSLHIIRWVQTARPGLINGHSHNPLSFPSRARRRFNGPHV